MAHKVNKKGGASGRTSVTGWISDDLKERIAKFLEKYPRIRSESVLVSSALEDYLEDSEKYGIDVNYKPRRKGREAH